MVEADDRAAPRVLAGDLHGILDGFRPGVDEDRVLLEVAGGELGELLGDPYVVLVRGDCEERVGELACLLGGGRGDLRMRVADRRDTDAAPEVDELIAVDVDEDRARAALHIDVGERARATRDAAHAALLQGDGSGAGQLGHEAALLRDAELHGESLRRTPRAKLGTAMIERPHPFSRRFSVRRSLPVRLTVTGTVAALALVLAGCAPGNMSTPGSKTGFDADGCATSGSASDSVKVTGDFGKEPKVEFDEKLSVENTQRSVVIEGTGDPAELGSELSLDLTLYDVATSTQLIPYSGEAQALTLDRAAVLSGIVDSLNCSREGDRVVGVIPPSRAFGANGQPDLGIAADATLLFVFDIVKISAPPEASAWTENVPEVTRDAEGKPTVTLPKVDAPTELQLVVLEAGDGAVVGRGDNVTINYQGTSWNTGKIFDQSFGGEPATFSTGGVIKGFEAALVGQKVGSTVMVVIPPELGYGTDPKAHDLGGQTLVFLIDIKDTAPPVLVARG